MVGTEREEKRTPLHIVARIKFGDWVPVLNGHVPYSQNFTKYGKGHHILLRSLTEKIKLMRAGGENFFLAKFSSYYEFYMDSSTTQ